MGEILSGINIAKQEVANMTVEAIYVAPDAVSLILNEHKLSLQEQEDALFELVDRTHNWLELDEDTQSEKIKICMVQATVVRYLEDNDIIRLDGCHGYTVGMRADDGSIVVEAMYAHMNREDRRMWERRAKVIAKKKARKALKSKGKVIELRRANEDE